MCLDQVVPSNAILKEAAHESEILRCSVLHSSLYRLPRVHGACRRAKDGLRNLQNLCLLGS